MSGCLSAAFQGRYNAELAFDTRVSPVMFRAVRWIVLAVAVTAGSSWGQALCDEPKANSEEVDTPAPPPSAPVPPTAPASPKSPTKGDVNRIRAEFTREVDALQKKYAELQAEEQKLVDRTSESLHGIIETAPESVAALRAIQALIELQFEDEESEKELFKVVLDHHLESNDLCFLCESLADNPAEPCVAFMRIVSEKAKDPRAKAWGFVSLASHECGQAEAAEDGTEGKGDLKKAEEYLEEALKLVPEDEMEASPRPVAVRRLYILQNLAVGKSCPEIEMKDLDGKPVKLSDYKGKVVVLDFWATWCGYCIELIPGQRELVKKYDGKPFALISISADQDPRDVVEFQKETPMPWVQWFNGPEGGVVDEWMIPGFPTLFVIDAKGVIRARDLRDEQEMDALVEKLIGEAEEKPASEAASK